MKNFSIYWKMMRKFFKVLVLCSVVGILIFQLFLFFTVGVRTLPTGGYFLREYFFPFDITVDQDDTIYVAAGFTPNAFSSVLSITQEGEVTNVIGDKISGLLPPKYQIRDVYTTIATDKSKNIFCASRVSCRIYKTAPKSGKIAIFMREEPPRTEEIRINTVKKPIKIKLTGLFTKPIKIKCDAKGNLYFFSQPSYTFFYLIYLTPDSDKFKQFTLTMQPTLNKEQVGDILDFAIKPNGTFYVIFRQGSNQIYKTIDNKVCVPITNNQRGYADGPLDQAKFWKPISLDSDEKGNIYVIDSQPNYFYIRKIDSSNMVSTLSILRKGGYKDGLKGIAQCELIGCLSCDSKDGIYFIDPYNSAIRKIDKNGTVQTFFKGVRTGGRFWELRSRIAQDIEIYRDLPLMLR